MKERSNIVCIGEVLWDLLPEGPQLGGAPSNLACHVAGLGGRATLISRVGDDDLGRRALSILSGKGVDVSRVVVDSAAPTGTVGVTLEGQGQPKFTIHERVAWDRLTADGTGREAVGRADAVCFGSLAQRTPEARAAVQALVGGVSSGAVVVCDINLRAPFYDKATLERSMELATVLKLNDGELGVLGGFFGLGGSQEAQAEGLARRFGLEAVLLTLGAEGSRLWTGGRWFVEPGRQVSVRDTIGAGDSFTAAYLVGRLKGWDPAATLHHAAGIAAYVCTQAGATPDLPPDLLRPFLED